MNKRSSLIFLPLIGMLLLAACGNLQAPQVTPTTPPMVTLKASGSGTITSVLESITPAFEAATPGYKLEVLPGNNTGSGVTGILENLLDVAAMARAPKDEESAKNIEYYEMGLVGQAIITHPTVTGVTSLNKEQVIGIFSGEIRNWSEVGGPNLKIVLYVRDEDDSSTKGLRKAIVGETPFPETVTVLTSQGDMLLSVEGTAGSIGIAAWPATLALKAKVQGIAINEVQPDDPSYPILGSAGIGYLAERKSNVQPLIDWLSSAEGQAVLKTLGFVSTQ